MFHDPSIKLVHTQFTISPKLLLFAKVKLLVYKDSSSLVQGTGQQNAPLTTYNLYVSTNLT
jgi:hypothetical protein